MIRYENNVEIGVHVLDDCADETLIVTDVKWRTGHGWLAFTQRPSGHSGPTFYPHPDRMPDPDSWVYSGSL
jgi:hypothetical protein